MGDSVGTRSVQLKGLKAASRLVDESLKLLLRCTANYPIFGDIAAARERLSKAKLHHLQLMGKAYTEDTRRRQSGVAVPPDSSPTFAEMWDFAGAPLPLAIPEKKLKFLVVVLENAKTAVAGMQSGMTQLRQAWSAAGCDLSQFPEDLVRLEVEALRVGQVADRLQRALTTPGAIMRPHVAQWRSARSTLDDLGHVVQVQLQLLFERVQAVVDASRQEALSSQDDSTTESVLAERSLRDSPAMPATPVEVRAAMQDGSGGAAKKSLRREEANRLIAEFLSIDPSATIREVVLAVGCAAGTVSQSPAWRSIMERRKVARGSGRAPVYFPAIDCLTADGDNVGSQDRAARESMERLDDEIDERDAITNRLIGEVLASNPELDDEGVAGIANCTAGDVERYRSRHQRFD